MKRITTLATALLLTACTAQAQNEAYGPPSEVQDLYDVARFLKNLKKSQRTAAAALKSSMSATSSAESAAFRTQPPLSLSSLYSAAQQTRIVML